MQKKLQRELNCQKEGIDKIAKDVVDLGLGLISNEIEEENKIIVKGQSNLFSRANEISDLEELFRKLDEKKTLKTLLDKSIDGQGVQIFIGAETKIFELAGCSMIIAPYKNKKKSIVGAIGVIGSSRMSYSRVITLVDYTAKLLSDIV